MPLKDGEEYNSQREMGEWYLWRIIERLIDSERDKCHEKEL